MIVVFMVAGMSSRFGGNPKQFAIIGNKETGKTLIEYSVNQALEAAKNICSIDKIIFITNPNTEELFKNLFSGKLWNNRKIKFEYVQQDFNQATRSRPWGTCGAVCSLQGHVDQPFILLNGDDIYGEETFKKGYKMLLAEQNNIIGGCKMVDTMPENGLVNRGLIETNSESYVTSMRELLKISKKDNPELHDKLGNVNFIGLLPKTVELLTTILDRFKAEHQDDPKIECLLPDNLNELIQTKQITMKAFQITNKIYGITHPGDDVILRQILEPSPHFLLSKE